MSKQADFGQSHIRTYPFGYVPYSDCLDNPPLERGRNTNNSHDPSNRHMRDSYEFEFISDHPILEDYALLLFDRSMSGWWYLDGPLGHSSDYRSLSLSAS